MSNQRPENLSVAEWKVMKIVWELQACAARDVYTIIQEKYGWQPVTTKTVLRRLVDKRHLKTKQIGNSYLYEPISTMKDTICEAAEELLEDTPSKMSASLMFHMVKKGNLDYKDARKLRDMLDQYVEEEEDDGDTI